MGGITINEREWSYEWSGERSRERSRERSGERSGEKYLKWSGETLLDFLQCRSWSFTILEYNINISTLVYVSFMVSVTTIVLVGMGSGLLLFMMIPLCGYLFYDIGRATRASPPLQGPALI